MGTAGRDRACRVAQTTRWPPPNINLDTACAGGTASAVEGATSVATFAYCQSGTSAPVGSLVCSLCEPGTVASAVGSATCQKCAPVRSDTKWGLSHAHFVRRGRRVRQAVCLGMSALTFLSVQVRQASCSTWCCPTAVRLLPRLCNQILGLEWPLRPRRGANVRCYQERGDHQDHSGACS